MKKVITESQLRNFIKKTISKALNKHKITETSRRQKAQQAIKGTNRKVKTLAIISAQNPMGQKADKEYNKKAQEKLIQHLKVGHFRYFVTDGLYETPETSVMVYNISLEDSKFLCYRYNQESMIFIDMTNDDNINYEYWEGEDKNLPLQKKYVEHEIVDATNDDDYYTKISRKFKFRIPFFESITAYNKQLKDCKTGRSIDDMISECIGDDFTGKHKYITRGEIDKSIQMNAH